MKHLAWLALVSLPAYSASYIVKFSSHKALSAFNNARILNVDVGSFAVVESSDKDFIAKTRKMSGIEYAEPNATFHALEVQDADFNKQWGFQNDGKNSSGWFSRGVAGVDIGAVEAWTITKGSQRVKIAVIDTGVDYNHPDLKNQIMINALEQNGAVGVDDDKNGYVDDVYGYDFANMDADPIDGHGHGTHCAGVIGAEHNAIGIAGVMAQVQILPIKFLSDDGSGQLEQAILSIDYAIKRGVNIMSNSWGGGPRLESLLEVIKKAEAAGILFVAAAGNSKRNNDSIPTYPANYEVDSLVTVGAIDGKGQRASFSNYGARTVDVYAPGVDTYSTVKGGKYQKMSGTSMACPHVAGVAGLILAKNPRLSPLEVRQRLMDTAVDADGTRGTSLAGRVNAAAALR